MVTRITISNHAEKKVAKTHNFTLRLPKDVYVEVYELSVTQGKTLNAAVIDLIKIAMSHKVDVRQALQELLDKEFGNDAIIAESEQPLP